MRIVAVDVVPYAVPLVAPLATARGALRCRVGCVVRVRADDGTTGIGDAAPHPRIGTAGLAALEAELAPFARWLVGAQVERCDGLLEAAGRLGGAAAMGVDTALHDLLARARGVAVVELLGGARRRVAASALLGADAVRSARAACDAGFRVAKLKASADPYALAGVVAALRSEVPGLALRLDANGSWDVATACAVVRALPRDGIEWIEQPVTGWDLSGLAQVRRVAQARGHAIAADEAVTGPTAVRRIAAAGAADVVVLKLQQLGGLRRALASAQAASAAGLRVVVTTGIDTSLGTAAALHLAAAVAALGNGASGVDSPDAGLATTHLLAGDIVREPLAPAPSLTPQGPGLGVVLDERALLRLAATRAEMA